MFKIFSTFICCKKYIKWGVWRVAVCLSYISETRFLMVNKQPESVYGSSYMFWHYIAIFRERS
jgi:membrane-anchored protein YejM (alkaline phosphatase superfamily)